MKQNNIGQSMFEVVIAIFIISMVIVGIVSLSTTALSNSLFSRNKTLAGRYSQEAIEWVRSEREKDSAWFIERLTSPTYCLDNPSLNWSNTGVCGATEFITGTSFIRNLSFITSVIDTKNIILATVTTSWTDSKGKHEAKSVTNFSDIREKI